MKTYLLLACTCLSLIVVNAQSLLSPQLVLYTDVTVMATSYAAFEGDTGFVNFPCQFWTEEFTDSTGAVMDTSTHFYYDKNNPDLQYNHSLTEAFGNLNPQTVYFYRQHAVDTNGNHYYSHFSSLKTAGTVSGIAESTEKAYSVTVNGSHQLKAVVSQDYVGSTFEVFNINGQQVMQDRLVDEITTTSLDKLLPGTYLVSLTPSTSSVKRVVVRITLN